MDPDDKKTYNNVVLSLVEGLRCKHFLEDVKTKYSHRNERKRKMEHILERVESVKQLIDVIKQARVNKTVLRVIGSKHSNTDAIFPTSGKTLELIGDFRKMEFQREVKEQGEKFLYCRVGAGCNLGKDPMNPYYSTLENSVCYQIEKKGYAFSELGGIIHQTVGGFIMTGSAGGSLKHGFADVIQDIEFVDGTGTLRKTKPGEDLWSAVGVSMGLFGVITHVTFRLPQSKLIQGSESNYEFKDSSLGPDETGRSKLKASLEKNEYFRVNWFPQKQVQRVQEWVGEQTTSGEVIPYHSSVEKLMNASMAALTLAFYDAVLYDPELNQYTPLHEIAGSMLKQFVPVNEDPIKFRDVFYKTLCMDNKAHVDVIIKVDFTEIWIPIDQCQVVMDKLQALFRDNPLACGNFATELYGAKKSPFWLSMSYGGDMVRVDPYWWAYNIGDRHKYFTFYWDALLDIPGTRLHWGKHLPNPGQKCGTKTFNLAYLKTVYPNMGKWLDMRSQMDPDQIFVTNYWRNIFEIPLQK